jgi:protein-S-isoprenylcysteine O-methyltransferase Ste14
MDELGIERDKLVISDRADARSLAKVDMRPQIWISILFIGGYFILLCALLLGDIKLEGAARDQFAILIGVLTASVTAIMAFWFGSTAGSTQKTKLLADSVPAKTQN